MDTDPRIIEINLQIKLIEEQIKQQRAVVEESRLLSKLKEWRKLNKLKYELSVKEEFKDKLISTLQKRKTKRRKSKNKSMRVEIAQR